MDEIYQKYHSMPVYAYYHDMQLYNINMQLYAQNMHKICTYIDWFIEICKDMHEICQKYA